MTLDVKHKDRPFSVRVKEALNEAVAAAEQQPVLLQNPPVPSTARQLVVPQHGLTAPLADAALDGQVRRGKAGVAPLSKPDVDEMTFLATSKWQQAPLLDEVRGGSAQLVRGMMGGSVVKLQRMLNALGVQPPLDEDGKLGPLTEAALKSVQTAGNIPGDAQGGLNQESLGLVETQLAKEPAQRVKPKPYFTFKLAGEDYNYQLDHMDGDREQNALALGGSALGLAKSQLGFRETGDNQGVGKFTGGQSVPWCAGFVSWAFKKSGHPLPGGGSLSVDGIENGMKGAGQLFPRSQIQPQAGDVIFFKSRAGSDAGSGRHVGIVDHVENGKVFTVEGNSGNKVAERRYSLSDPNISGYGRNT